MTVEPASELPSPAGDPAAPVAPEEPHDENDEQKGTGVVSSPPTKRPPSPFYFQLRQVAAARVCSSLSGPTPALKVRTMSETVERSSLDLRFEGYRLRDEAAEARLLASISERGIEEPLGGVDTPQGRVLLDGFRRNRCAAKLGLECVPYVSWGTDETLGIASLLGEQKGTGVVSSPPTKRPPSPFHFRSAAGWKQGVAREARGTDRTVAVERAGAGSAPRARLAAAPPSGGPSARLGRTGTYRAAGGANSTVCGSARREVVHSVRPPGGRPPPRAAVSPCPDPAARAGCVSRSGSD